MHTIQANGCFANPTSEQQNEVTLSLWQLEDFQLDTMRFGFLR
jgi:hypothetical protein